jgi:hypothetical protein
MRAFPAHIAILLSGCCLLQSSTAADIAAIDCALTPLEEQLQIAELRTNDPEYIEVNYRKRLLRFVNSYYSNIAEDLLRGQGEYLLSLHRLMGSANDGCTDAYKALLVQEVNSQDFGIALWTLRVGSQSAARAWPAFEQQRVLIQ